VIAGAGVAIKTLEALLHERPVLATRQALRGLPDKVVQTIGYQDDPMEYARSLLSIVGDHGRYRAKLEQSRRAARLLAECSFWDTLGSAVDAVRLEQPAEERLSFRRKTEVAGEI
jgi:hypothetical protein